MIKRWLILLLALPLLSWAIEGDRAGMVRMDAGTFVMGHGTAPPNGPRREVTLDAFWVDRTEVTVGAYRQCVVAGLCNPLPDNASPLFFGNEQPMVMVNWSDAGAYCRWAGKRLPTEAEWERAARGTQGRVYPWGNRYRQNYANLLDTEQAPVDLRRYRFSWPAGAAANDCTPEGVCDLAGNVAEWTADVYRRDYHRETPTKNPRIDAEQADPQGMLRYTVRGGCFATPPQNAEAFYRDGYRHAASRGLRLGFRCARDDR